MITEGYLARHHMGRRGMTGPALLDVAQDYALEHLFRQGVFDLGVVLKGGTSLRKFRAGKLGRFSTDLDFAAPDADTGELLLDTLDNATIEGVSFHVTNRSALRGTLDIETPLGRPDSRPRSKSRHVRSGSLPPPSARSTCQSIRGTSSSFQPSPLRRWRRRWPRSSLPGAGGARSATSMTCTGSAGVSSTRYSCGGSSPSRCGTTSSTTGWERVRSTRRPSSKTSTPTGSRLKTSVSSRSRSSPADGLRRSGIDTLRRGAGRHRG